MKNIVSYTFLFIIKNIIIYVWIANTFYILKVCYSNEINIFNRKNQPSPLQCRKHSEFQVTNKFES